MVETIKRNYETAKKKDSAPIECYHTHTQTHTHTHITVYSNIHFPKYTYADIKVSMGAKIPHLQLTPNT